MSPESGSQQCLECDRHRSFQKLNSHDAVDPGIFAKVTDLVNPGPSEIWFPWFREPAGTAITLIALLQTQ